MNADPARKFLTTKEVAGLLHVNEKMVYSLVSEKGLPATKVTGKWLFPKKLVEEWLETHIINYRRQTAYDSADQGILLFAGSDDLLFQRALSLYHARQSETVGFFANLGSMGGLKSLRRGAAHVGVCHLLQDDNEEYNFGFAAKELDRVPVVVNFSLRRQGLLVPRGNPKKIAAVADLAKRDVTIVNRPLGTGTRLLLDYEIAKSAISSNQINGYRREVSRHLEAGLAVFSGEVDAAPAIEAVAGLLGLDFVPLRWERFDLLIDKERFFDRAIQAFITMLHEQEFRQLAEQFVGYDLSICGNMLFPDNLAEEE